MYSLTGSRGISPFPEPVPSRLPFQQPAIHAGVIHEDGDIPVGFSQIVLSDTLEIGNHEPFPKSGIGIRERRAVIEWCGIIRDKIRARDEDHCLSFLTARVM